MNILVKHCSQTRWIARYSTKCRLSYQVPETLSTAFSITIVAKLQGIHPTVTLAGYCIILTMNTCHNIPHLADRLYQCQLIIANYTISSVYGHSTCSLTRHNFHTIYTNGMFATDQACSVGIGHAQLAANKQQARMKYNLDRACSVDTCTLNNDKGNEYYTNYHE